MDEREVMELVHYLEVEHGVYVSSVDIKDVRCGRASHFKSKIILPTWIFDDDVAEEYQYYYIIHEVAHLVDGVRLGQGHDDTFKAIESEMLDDFNLSVDYARAYPSNIYSNGNLICDGSGRRTSHTTKDFDIGEIVRFNRSKWVVKRRNQKTVSLKRTNPDCEQRIKTYPSEISKI